MSTETPTTPTTATVSKTRRISFITLASLLAVFTGLVMGGLPALVLGTFDTSTEQIVHQVHALHWGALMGVLMAVPLAALAIRHTLVAPAQQVTLVMASFLLAAGVARMFDPSLLIFVVLIGLLLFLHPQRKQLLRAGEGFDLSLGVLAAAVTAARRRPTTSAAPRSGSRSSRWRGWRPNAPPAGACLRGVWVWPWRRPERSPSGSPAGSAASDRSGVPPHWCGAWRSSRSRRRSLARPCPTRGSAGWFDGPRLSSQRVSC